MTSLLRFELSAIKRLGNSSAMPYLLDSDVLIYYTNGVAATQTFVEQGSNAGISVSAVSLMEVQQGVWQGPRSHDAQIRLNEFLEWAPVVAFGRAEAMRCAAIRGVLQRQGKRVRQRALDLMIAATALEHGLILVTNNLNDYQDIPGLQLQSAQVTP